MTSIKKKNKPLEIELKYSLARSEYLKLKHALKNVSHKNKKQLNYYFDTPALDLRKKKIGLRIRTVGSQSAIVTIKFPKPSKKTSVSSLKIRYEYEAPIPVKTAKAILKGRKKISTLEIEPIAILKSKTTSALSEKLICLGALKTNRTTYHYPKDLFLELDESSFLDKKFYELEAETKNPRDTDKKIRELLESLEIKCSPENTSKLQRFLREWKQIKKRPKSKS